MNSNHFQLFIQPQNPPLSWYDFTCVTPKYSIALDGYVTDGPRFNANGPWANFNHHEQVDRLATRCTCAQILIAERQGLFEAFSDRHGIRINCFVNDCDEDVCTSVFLLRNPHLCQNTINPAINRLVHMEDMLDTTAGAYPFPTSLPILEEVAWIFQPYRIARLSGALERKNPEEYEGIIGDVNRRIMAYVMGNGERIALDTRFEVLAGSTDKFSIIREIGAQARTGVFASGIKVFIAVRPRPDGRNTITIGKLSPFIPVDLVELVKDLNAEENIQDGDSWGGGDTIIGSPRVKGTGLEIAKIAQLLSERFSK